MKDGWEFGHSGIFVKDFDRTLKYFKSLGLTPELGPTLNPFSPKDKTSTMVFGKPSPPRDPAAPYFLALLYIGDLELEVLHAPEVRPTGEALAYGEGINHVCFNVPDLDKETEDLIQKGFRLVLDFRRNDERLEDYLDTREFGNIFLSLRTPQTPEAKSRKAGYGIIDWKFYGHSAVVKDLDKTIEYYKSMDIADIQPQKMFDSGLIDDIKMSGNSPKTRIAAKTGLPG
jgi:catechol 2,3-dioxygenase-like lactoylglutathione lyase family enzyme